MDWPSPTAISAPIAPGGVDRPSDTASVNTATSSAPSAWHFSADGGEIAQIAEHVGRLHHDAGRVRRWGQQVLRRQHVGRERRRRRRSAMRDSVRTTSA